MHARARECVCVASEEFNVNYKNKQNKMPSFAPQITKIVCLQLIKKLSSFPGHQLSVLDKIPTIFVILKIKHPRALH